MASSTHKRLRPDSDDDELNPQQFTSQQNANIAQFLILKSEEKDRKVSDPSPFAIEKSIQAIAGHPKSIKRLKSGDLLLEVEKKSHITNLFSTKKLFNLNVKISLHVSLNTSKGVIRCQDLGPCTDNIIFENLKSEGVIHVRNIQVRRNGVLERTLCLKVVLNFLAISRQWHEKSVKKKIK